MAIINFSMIDSFESPKFLITQTRVNILEIESLFNSTFEGKCWSGFVDVDPKTGNKIYKIKFVRNLPPKVRHLAATAVSDLRHSLDQATTASVELVSGKPAANNIYFPFANNPDDLNGRLKRSFPTELHSVFHRFQPYPTGIGHCGGNNHINLLRDAAGPNKHQATCRVHGAVTEWAQDDIKIFGLVGDFTVPPTWDMSKNEMVVATTAAWGDCNYNFNMAVDIVFYKAGRLTGLPVIDFIKFTTDVVENIVLDLERETTNIIKSSFA